MADEKAEQKDYRHIVRVAETDLDGSKPVYHALNKIKGVSFMFANAICSVSDVDRMKKTGNLNQDEVQKLTDVIKNPAKYGIPTWLMNRRKDPEFGGDRHSIGADLKWQLENDLKVMKKVKSYKGVRHMLGLPVRGQKTKNNFRKKKGKGSLGVQRKKTAPARK
ncbi:30S ribosomal protein S13 [Candidatus Woesearchaeota archaeon]|nr:30S ribosomal protein S13 [Candidatus Woesearchaeota archaeon]